MNEDYQQLDDSVQVNIRVAFEFDSAALSPGEQAKLDAVCQAINNSDIPLFRIIGQTDASGADDYNQRLSLLRAEEVQRHLVNSCGIAPERLEALGVGEAFPFDPNDPRADVTAAWNSRSEADPRTYRQDRRREAQRMVESRRGDIFRPGDLLNNTYRIEKILGRGGTSEVYQARNEISGRLIAIKALKSEFAGD